MAEIQPLRALHYSLEAVGSLDSVAAPPYDVIDAAMRAELAGRSPFNVVELDLPSDDAGDPYERAGALFETWRRENIIVRDREPSIWALTQDYTVPGTDRQVTRHGFFARVRVADYGAGTIRPHERTQPGPKEDRLRLTRATRANLSPIFSLFPDPDNAAWGAIEPHTSAQPFGTVTDEGGALNKLWRIESPDTIAAVQSALADAELLIADGHHRYETARAYAAEVGGEGEHAYVLMFLCSLSDPGLTVLPTHRLLTNVKDSPGQQALRDAIKRDFEITEISADELEPPADAPGVSVGYMDSFHKQPYRLTLRDQAIADAAMPDRPEPYRRLDTAVLETLLLGGALGMSVEDIAAKRGLAYSKSFADALDAVESGRCDAAFFMRGTPIEQVIEVAESGQSMPPKSTYFFPKIPTGLIFNSLE